MNIGAARMRSGDSPARAPRSDSSPEDTTFSQEEKCGAGRGKCRAEENAGEQRGIAERVHAARCARFRSVRRREPHLECDVRDTERKHVTR